jgi:gas vesicle protein
MAFYIHLGVFLFVNVALVIVNWLATPEVWWAQWPLLGWAFAVIAHGLCASGGSNFITNWQLRKIREMRSAERIPHSATNDRKAMLSPFLIGLLLGGAILGAAMYARQQSVEQQTKIAKDELQRVNSDLRVRENAAAEQIEKLKATQQTTEKALNEARESLREREAERDAARKALEETKRVQRP